MRGLLFSALFATIVGAQEYRATVLGTVTDPAGAAVPMASVIATNDETGVSSRTQSNNEGGYQIPYLQPGFYTLEVTHPGFKTHHLGPIELRVNDRAKIDVRLEIGLTANRLRFQPTLRT